MSEGLKRPIVIVAACALLDSEGHLSHEYSCLLGDRAWNASSLDDVEVRDGDEVVIMLPIAGGA